MNVLVVRAEPDDVEVCSDWLFELGATAIEERSVQNELILVAGFTSDHAALHARSILIERWPCRLEGTGDEATWRDEWLKWIEPIEVAGLVIHAPWHDPATWPGDLDSISIDPGRAFGSGHHPTTRLALTALRNAVGPNSTVLDVGFGTGILSIAAAKLGARAVVGIDLDYDIVEVASANAEANGVASKVELRTEPVDGIDQFDIVVANIVIGDLQPLLPAIVAASTGQIVISGFLADQLDDLIANLNVQLVERTTLQGWSCAVLRRSA